VFVDSIDRYAVERVISRSVAFDLKNKTNGTRSWTWSHLFVCLSADEVMRIDASADFSVFRIPPAANTIVQIIVDDEL
jgi:hypothetical protein